MKQPSEKSTKKPYQSPKLLVYGDLAEMTKAVGRLARIDGGGNPQKRRTGR
jgi:hypothetical protein